ncbi:Ubiquitin carboxyl-terminal hydrolase isozyme L3 [Mortierella sp. NVP85]|nr:Ubiquitin carboxyl-terminal hydrolase isozyme L3 [Mortierella sp. NVP85]
MSEDAPAKTKKSIRWLALESNPDYVRDLGVQAPWRYVDVLGLDDEMLAWVPSPVHALILLFPVTPAYEKFVQDEQARIDEGICSKHTKESSDGAEGEQGSSEDQAAQEKEAPSSSHPEPIFYRQTISNACGTMGVLHSLANNWPDNKELNLKEDGIILNFLKKTRDLNPDDRAIALEEDEAFATVHRNHASTGQTETPDLQAEVNLHFVCLVQKGGRLYELDGNKKQPIDHGPCTSFLHNAISVAREFVARDPENFQFSVIAATTAPPEE